MAEKITIHKQSKFENFTIVTNEIIRNDKLSWKARGMLIYLLSLPNDFSIYKSEIIKHSPSEGRIAFDKGWDELKEQGYIKEQPKRAEKGKFGGLDIEIYEFPPLFDNRQRLTDSGSPSTVNQQLLSTNNTNNLLTKDILLSIEYLNEQADTKFRTNSKQTRTIIGARLKDGFTLKDIKQVIDNKVNDWKGTDMEQYLRPSTLFAPTKFEAYLNQPRAPKKVVQTYSNPHETILTNDQIEQYVSSMKGGA